MARNFTVKVKEDGTGNPWLLVEPADEIGLPKGQHIVMGLADDADLDQARAIARFLNQNLTTLRVEHF